jgi:hypothetical protein
MRAATTVLVLLTVVGAARSAEAPGLKLDREIVERGLLRGSPRISATASVPSGMRALFRVIGPTETLRLRTKTRLGGLIWANTGERIHEDVPAVLLVHGWPRMPSEENLRRHGLGRSALAAKLLPPDAGPGDHRGFRELIELKEALGLYARTESQGSTADGRAEVEFTLADASPAGEYAVEVHVLDGDRLVSSDARRLVLRRSAAVVALARTAREHAVLYAIAAVLGAIGGGLLAGLLIGIRARRRKSRSS